MTDFALYDGCTIGVYEQTRKLVQAQINQSAWCLLAANAINSLAQQQQRAKFSIASLIC